MKNIQSVVSITVLCLLCSPCYTAVRIKNCSKSLSVIKVATRKSTDSAAHPSYHLKLKYIHFPSLSAMFNSIHSSTNQEMFEKHLCNQGSHYGKYRWFPLLKGSCHVQPPNQCFSLSAKMNGTQRRTLVNLWRMLCTNGSMPKGTSSAEVTSNSEKIQPIALAVTLVWRHQAGS